MNCIFFVREIFLMFGGGGQAEAPRLPPPCPRNGKPWPGPLQHAMKVLCSCGMHTRGWVRGWVGSPPPPVGLGPP